jgi:acyl carrier protein
MTTPALSRTEVYEQIKHVLVSEFKLQPEQLDLRVHLVDDLGLDSIDRIDMVIALEEKTGQSLEEHEFASIHTIGDVVDAVYRKLQPTPP